VRGRKRDGGGGGRRRGKTLLLTEDRVTCSCVRLCVVVTPTPLSAFLLGRAGGDQSGRPVYLCLLPY
jgi:hypothetical protein